MKKEMPTSEFLEGFTYTVEEARKIIDISSMFSIPMTLYLIKCIRSYSTNDK